MRNSEKGGHVNWSTVNEQNCLGGRLGEEWEGGL